jgi:CheY-like chemotaxis protein
MDTSIRVLVVDDSEILRTGIELLLRHFGFINVSVDKDGLSAYERLVVDGDFGLVITDHNMPLMTGLQLIERIRETPELAHMRVILTSGDNIAREALAVGADVFLHKPPNINQLRDAITKFFP